MILAGTSLFDQFASPSHRDNEDKLVRAVHQEVEMLNSFHC